MSAMTTSAATLETSKICGAFAASSELMEQPGADALLSRSLRNSVSAAADEKFVSSIIGGVTTISATAAPLVDMKAALRAVDPTDQSRLFWIASPDAAIALSTFGSNNVRTFPGMSPVGGELLELPALVTTGLGGGSPHSSLLLIDASSIMASADEPQIEVSRQTSLQLSNTPSMHAMTPTAANTLGLWQTNSVAVKCTVNMAAEVVRANAVALIENDAW